MNFTICLVAVPLAILAGGTGWLRDLVDEDPGWLADHGNLLEAVARIVALLPAIVLGAWIFHRLRERLINDNGKSDAPAQPDVDWLQDLQRSAIDRLEQHDRKAIALFVQLIIDPARGRSRLTEVIDLDHRAVTQQVTITFSLPPTEDGGKAFYIPVLQPLKGELVDNFHLRSAAGDSLPTMSYEESVRLASAGLRLLLTQIFAGPEGSADLWALDDSVRAAELALLHLIAVRGPVNARAVEQKAEVVLKKINFPEDQSRERVRKYVAALSVSYPIIAVVPAAEAVSGRILIKYERTFIPSSLSRGRRGLLRLSLGLNPDQVAVPVELALTADSYHLRINAPSNKYVLKQHLQCRHCLRLATREWRGAIPTKGSACAHEVDDTVAEEKIPFHPDHHFRVRRKRGQSWVHVYMRGYGKEAPKLRDLQLLARFKEVPPGARGRAVVTALATTMLIAVAGNLINRPAGAQVGGLPALMLALPAVAASWFGLSSEREALVGGSLLARISLIVSGCVSVLGVLLYLATPPSHGSGHIWHDWTFVGITDWRWQGPGKVVGCLA
ncbi:hypothetical protein [Micromonospora sp. NPDC005806]|uniref:hypothetical protein n=1 Tax=Micromonospora sp. NPDC005806 TaxID=3364234 RepID=UPI0036846387